MKTTMRWFILALVLLVGLVWEHGVAGTVLGTTGRTCYPTTFSTASGTTNIFVYGDWIENIDRATASGSGVTVTIVGKFNGFQNNTQPFKGKGKVRLKISTSNASVGDRTISLINDPDLGLPGETFTFTINIRQACP